MKTRSLTLLLPFFIFLIACSSKNHYLLKTARYTGSGYINQKGDTIVPEGKYLFCYTDTLHYFAVVKPKNSIYCEAIDKKGHVLFDIYDAGYGPDSLSDGLIRILKNGYIGYADFKGNIAIKPKYRYAEPFKNGIAKVTTEFYQDPRGDIVVFHPKNWVYINKKGRVQSTAN